MTLLYRKKEIIMPAVWTFRCYRTVGGRDVVSDWYEKQRPEVQAKFDTTIEFLIQAEPHEWDRPSFGKLAGPCAGLGEIRFKAGRTQHRPLGFTEPGCKFTIVFVAQEKGGRFVPPTACETALSRKTEVLQNGSRADVCGCL